VSYRSLPPGASFRMCRKLIRNMLEDMYSRHAYHQDVEDRSVAHIHLETPITGVVLSDTWTKLDLSSANFDVKTLDGFTFDSDNDRIYWDEDGAINSSLSAFFVGDAGITVTSTISGSITVSMGLFIDGVNVIETPLTYTQQDKIQSYGSNSILIDLSTLADLLQSGSYIELFSKAGTGETPTVTLETMEVTFKKD